VLLFGDGDRVLLWCVPVPLFIVRRGVRVYMYRLGDGLSTVVAGRLILGVVVATWWALLIILSHL
jgi:hypothetical protein